MRRLSAILPLLLTSAFAAAQTSVDGAQPLLLDQFLHQYKSAPETLSNLQATPLWGTPDGRILAIVASADSSVPAKPQWPQVSSAADWKLVDVTNFASSGLLLNLSRGASVYATFGRGSVLGPAMPSAALACSPLLSSVAVDASCGERFTIARSGAMQLGTDWTILDNLDLDLSYGQAWFRHDAAPGISHAPIDLFGTLANPQFPTLLIPGLDLSNVQNTEVSALGRWRFDAVSSVDLGASLTRMQLSSPIGNTPLTSLNQAAVTFGMRYGAFSGNVTGHLLGPADTFNPNARWSGLDIGISWRTPWQGQLSFGTQNLWSSGNMPNLAEPNAREGDPNQARVPYVQYHQDL